MSWTPPLQHLESPCLHEKVYCHCHQSTQPGLSGSIQVLPLPSPLLLLLLQPQPMRPTVNTSHLSCQDLTRLTHLYLLNLGGGFQGPWTKHFGIYDKNSFKDASTSKGLKFYYDIICVKNSIQYYHSWDNKNIRNGNLKKTKYLRNFKVKKSQCKERC